MRLRRLAVSSIAVVGVLCCALAGSAQAAGPSAGGNHSCWVAPETERAYCWGADFSFGLGNGAVSSEQIAPSPVDASRLPGGLATKWRVVASGDGHTCGIASAGNLYCWGTDNGGRLGTGPGFQDGLTPLAVDVSGLPAGTTWRVVAPGVGDHTCAVTDLGAAYCWGGDSGKLGNGAPEGDQQSPTAVDMSALPGVSWADISGGREHTCGLTTDGVAYCWGNDASGELGNGAVTGVQASPSPVDVSGLPAGTRWARIDAAGNHTCALTTAGAAYCWGGDFFGQLGNGAATGNQESPSPVDAAGIGFADIELGDVHTCALTGAGAAYCWGSATSGRLGNGVTSGTQDVPAPVDMSGLPAGTAWASLSAGNSHTCGLTAGAKAYCWGSDGDGRLGNGAVTANQSKPEIEVTITLGVLADRDIVTGALGDPTNPGLTLTLVPAGTVLGDVQVAAVSSNEAVLPSANISVQGTGAGRAARFTPAGRGTATVTFSTSAGGSLSVNYAASGRIPDPSGRYHGYISDASTAIDVGDGYMLTANDETNFIFLHKQGESGPPVKIFDLTDDTELTGSEIDIESGARSGEVIVWLTSHGNSRSGGTEGRRRVTFATRITGSGADTELTFSGRYGGGPGNQTAVGARGMWNELISWDQNNGHGLGANALGFFAGTRPGVLPNAPSGFNIEALEFAPDGATGYLGFRAPTVGPDFKALIVPVPNILSLVDGVQEPQTGRAQFGAPIFLDLAGRSLRDMRRNANNEYLIVAGASPQNPSWALFSWDGDPAHQPQFNQLLPDENFLTAGAWEGLPAVPLGFQAGADVRVVADSGDTTFYDNRVNNDLEQPFMKSYSQAFKLKPVRQGEDRSGFGVSSPGKKLAGEPFSLNITGATNFDGEPLNGEVVVDVGTTNLGGDVFRGPVTFRDGAATVSQLTRELVTSYQFVVVVDGISEPVRLPIVVVARPLGPDIDPVEPRRLAMGTQHVCALFGGRAHCWGNSANGRLGVGSNVTGNITTPTPVDMSVLPDGARFVSLAAGNDSSCGLTADGAVYCWGRDFLAKLGNGSVLTTDQFSPSLVDVSGTPAGTQFVSLTMGRDQVCALTKAGPAYCWGYGGEGGVGNPAAQTEVPSPLPVDMSNLPEGARFASIDAGGSTTCALTTAGVPYCWGYNAQGQVGDGTTTLRRSPVAVDISALPQGTTFASVTGGRDHSCAVTAAGKAYCWGSDNSGQLGNGSAVTSQQPTPVAVESPEGVAFTALAAGDDTNSVHTCGLSRAGTAYCWGSNNEGALGFTAPGITHAPGAVEMPAGTAFTEISAGRRNTCAYTGAKTAYCWGNDATGQLGNGTALTGARSTPSLVHSPTAIEDVIEDVDPDVAPVSEVVESGETLRLVDDGGAVLVTATFSDPAGGSGKVVLARYAEGWMPGSTSVAIGGVVYDVHFTPTASTGPNATLTVEFTRLGPDLVLRHWDGDNWEPIVSDSGETARSDATGRATVVFGAASTPTLAGLGGTPIATTIEVDVEEGPVGGEVPATLSLTLGAPATFGALQPGVARDYTATTNANVISTAGDAALSIADPSATHTGHLVNGAFFLPQRVQANANGGAFGPVGGTAAPTTLRTYAAPVSNDAVTLGFKQSIGAGDALRTGNYSKTLTVTLSTTTP